MFQPISDSKVRRTEMFFGDTLVCLEGFKSKIEIFESLSNIALIIYFKNINQTVTVSESV